ncbi:MAG TPA: FAD-dependent oxidoreductase [Rectinemataceae bacterium]|nr:FAD-dependent oxidoreductase [Rectinemataceae bacterium]
MTVDYLVVGAGVVGLATACHLKRGEPAARVLLLEQKSRVCSGNSAKSAALYRNLFSSATSRILAESSIGYYETIAREINLRPNGYLWTFGERAWKESEPAIRLLAREASRVELLDAAGIGKMLLTGDGDGSPKVALFGRRCGSLSAMALAQHYADAFVRAGGVIRLDTKAESLNVLIGSPGAGRAESDRVGGLTDSRGERHEAGCVVVTAGCWMQDLLGPTGLATGIYPKKRQLFGVRVDELSALLPPGIAASEMPNIILPGRPVYLKPVLHRGLLLAGLADELARPFELPYGPVESARAEESYFRGRIEPAIRSFFPRLDAAHPEPLDVASSWAGHYDYYWPDRNPVIESSNGVVWAGGSSGSGIMKADAIGRIAAAAARGDDRAELADGSRFMVADLSLRRRKVAEELLVI